MNSAFDIHPKLIGGVSGAQVAALIVWILGLFHVTVEPVTALELGSVLVALGAYLAPLVQHELPPPIVVTPVAAAPVTPAK